MLTQKPIITTVRIKIQQYRAGKYCGSKSLTLYETTAAQVEQIIKQSISRNGK
jgi:hypothetical protein